MTTLADFRMISPPEIAQKMLATLSEAELAQLIQVASEVYLSAVNNRHRVTFGHRSDRDFEETLISTLNPNLADYDRYQPLLRYLRFLGIEDVKAHFLQLLNSLRGQFGEDWCRIMEDSRNLLSPLEKFRRDLSG